MRRVCALVLVVVLAAVACTKTADPEIESSGGPDTSEDVGAALGGAVTLTVTAEAAVATVDKAFGLDTEEEECVVDEFLEELESLDTFDESDSDEVRKALQLAKSCLGEQTVVDAVAGDILKDVPVLSEEDATCVAQALSDDEDLFVDVILADLHGTELSPQNLAAFFQIIKDCDLSKVIAQEIAGDEDVDVESAECLIDGMLDDEDIISTIVNGDSMSSADVPAIQAMFRLFSDCDLGLFVAQEFTGGNEISGEQGNCVLAGFADSPVLIEDVMIDENETPEALVAMFQIFSDCGLTEPIASMMFEGLDMTDAQKTCAAEQLLALSTTEIEALMNDDPVAGIALLLGIAGTCNIDLADL